MIHVWNDNKEVIINCILSIYWNVLVIEIIMKIISLLNLFFQFGCIWFKWMKFNCNHNEMIPTAFCNLTFHYSLQIIQISKFVSQSHLISILFSSSRLLDSDFIHIIFIVPIKFHDVYDLYDIWQNLDIRWLFLKRSIHYVIVLLFNKIVSSTWFYSSITYYTEIHLKSCCKW